MASRRARKLAAEMDRDVDRVEGEALRELSSLLNRVRVRVLRAVRGEGEVDTVVKAASERVESLMLDAMTASHLTGVRRVLLTARGRVRSRISLALDDTISDLIESLDLSAVTIEQVRRIYQSEARVAVLEANDAVSETLREAANESIRQGETTQSAIERMQVAMQTAGLGPENPWRYETVFRTQQNLAYSAGRGGMERNPIIAEELWGYEYVTAGDDRVRPSHVALDGTRLPKDHPRWGSIAPPNGWNCRCRMVMIFRDEGDERVVEPPRVATVDGKEVEPGPDEGFDFDPGQLFGVIRSTPGERMRRE